MKHNYDEPTMQAAIDAACQETKVPTGFQVLALRGRDSDWEDQRYARLHLLKSALDLLPEPPPPIVSINTQDCEPMSQNTAEALSAMIQAAATPQTFEEHGKTWNSHKKGDRMPCDGNRIVEVLGEPPRYLQSEPKKGSFWLWGSPSLNCIGWRYADEPTPEQPWTPKVGDANPVQDMALGGQMYWRDLAHQLADVWWKCHSIGASLQHGDIDNDVSFSVVCEKHGGQVFHADTPHNAWLKAEKWLMSPDRANFPAATLNLWKP